MHIIDFVSLDKGEESEFWNDSVQYILLKGACGESLGRIDKLVADSERIYASDTRRHSLVVYDRQGNGVGVVGNRGQGPQEYVSITDFDVDKYGTIYLLDNRLKKILYYNKSFSCLGEYKLPFEADVVSALENDSLLWGLSSWNHGKGEGYKLALTDKKLSFGNAFLAYDKYIDPSYWISDYRLSHSEVGVAYNQTIDNHVYIFSPNGKLKETFYVDFGKENVPDGSKLGVESKLGDYDHYTMIRKVLAVTDKYIVGLLWQHRETKLFVIDYKLNKYWLGKTIADIDRRVGCGYSDGSVISYIDSSDEALPDSINQFVENEGFVLEFRKLK